MVSEAQMYHQLSDEQFLEGVAVIDKLLRPKSGEIVLDLGCGTGRLALELASRVGSSGRVVAVDPDKERIAVAEAQLANSDSHVTVTYLVGSTKEAIPWRPFDAIFSNFVFHWFERIDRSFIMRDIYEMLKPGGRLVFQALPSQSQTRSLLGDVMRLVFPDKDPDSVAGMKLDSASVWSELCTEAGFVIEVCKVFEQEYVRPSLDAVLKFAEASISSFKSSMLKDSDVEELQKRYSSGLVLEIPVIPYSRALQETMTSQQISEGQMYHQLSDGQYRCGMSLIDQVLKPKSGETILDLGCGTGRLSLELASRVGSSGRIIGVDPDKSRITVANEEITNLDSHMKVTFLEGSTKEAIPLGPFDAIFSNHVFHWFERADRAAILADLYGMLKPGGRLAFLNLPQQGHTKNLFRDVMSLVFPDKDPNSVIEMKLDSASVWSQLCTEAGFVVELCEVFDQDEVETSLDVLFRVAEAAMSAFKSSMVNSSDKEELQKRYSSGRGTEVAYVLSILRVLARKPVSSP